jgi:hypothetical protein
MRSDAIADAVVLTKAALEASGSSAGSIDRPAIVSQFLEELAKKLDDLRTRA